MGPLAELPSTLRDYLREYEARSRRLGVLRASGAALAILLVWILGACAADRFLHLARTPRVALLGVAVGSAALVIGRAVLALPHGVNWAATAEQIERHNPRFGQSLVTVTSRLMGPALHRGSEEILSHLLHDLEAKVRLEREHRMLPPRRVAAPWLACVLLVGAAVALWQVPGFGLTRLLRRFAEPFADLPPVTTTRLDVAPGDRDLPQSATLRIEAQTQNLDARPLWLYTSIDGAWSRSAMTPTGAGCFTFSLNSVDRDIRYYLEGGDARTREYLVRVLRRPAVVQFKIRYVFPAFTGKLAATVTNTDGIIEAPTGTKASISVCASEPLQSALLTVGGEKILMSRSGDDSIRQAELVVKADARCELDMISAREIAGGGPATMLIRAIPDQPPVIRFSQAGQNIRLNPRDIVPLDYDVIDDFGIVSLVVRSQVNVAAATESPVLLRGDRRRQDGVFDFDLAARRLQIGDVVTLSLAATDTSGQVSVSEPLHVLISPRSIDLETHQRIAELQSAQQFAGLLIEELTAASKGLEEADAIKDHQSPAYSQASARTNRRLTSASEDATLMRQALYRATLHSRSPELSRMLADWIDAAQIQADAADDLFRRGGSMSGMGNVALDRLKQALEQGRRMQAQTQIVAQGQQAEAVLADRENLIASEHKSPPPGSPGFDRFAQTLARAREDVAAGARDLGIDPNAGDLEGRLKGKVEAAAALLRAEVPVDYAAAAHDWSQELQKSPAHHSTLEDRLSAAAEAEAIRPDADLSRARDLQLASRAAASIEWGIAQSPGKPAPAGLANEFAAVIAALAREHDLHRHGENRSSAEVALIHGGAVKAREQLARWAPDVEDPSASPPQPIAVRAAAMRENPAARSTSEPRVAGSSQSAEELALQASAAAASRDYAKSAALDRALMRKLAAAQVPGPSTRPNAPREGTGQFPTADRQTDDHIEKKIERQSSQVAKAMEAARRIDGLGTTQDSLTRQTETARTVASQQLVGRQKLVADEIAQVAGPDPVQVGSADASSAVDDPNWRGRATETLLEVQAQLAAMPQELADVLEAAQAARDTAMRAAVARQTAGSARPDQKLSAERAVKQATQDASDAALRLDRVIRPISPDTIETISNLIAPFAPEAASAHEVMEQQLSGALRSLVSAARSGDANAAARAAADSRAAIDTAQRELARAQDAFTERDPLRAAKWFARAAADSLSRQPPDLHGAQGHQARVSVALARAWDRSIHEAAARRLAAVPALQPVYAPEPSTGHGKSLAGGLAVPGFGAAREWGRLRPRDDDSVNLTFHESDPAGYEESLKLYFEALGNAQEGKGN